MRASGWIAHVLGALTLAGLIMTAVAAAQQGQLLYQGPFLFFLCTTLVAGWFLAWKRPRNSLGWLLIVIVLWFASNVPVDLLGAAVRPSNPEVAAWLHWWGSDREDTWVWLPPIALLFTQVPLRFPTGRLPSPRWRWFSWFTIVAIVVGSILTSTISAEVVPGLASPTYVDWGGPDQAQLVVFAVLFGLLLPSFLGSLASLFVRYRRAGTVERAQLRWVFWGACIPIFSLIAAWFIPETPLWLVLQPLVLATYSLIPLSILFAVLRYRLYEIDRIISRTAAWAIVTLTVVGTYVAVILTVGALLPDLPSLGVALATLIAAAVFLPLLRWVRRVVDRRFDREHYDAEKVVDAFGEHLRTEVNPDTTQAELVGAVEQTLQPASIGIWTPGATR